MSRKNYIEAYDLEETIEKASSIAASISRSTPFRDALVEMRELDVLVSDSFRVRTLRSGEKIQLGREKRIKLEVSPRCLVLSGRDYEPLLVLEYLASGNQHSKYLVVSYVQTPENVSNEKYVELRESLGLNPHEFLFGHLLGRVGPLLNLFPEVEFRTRYIQWEGKIYGTEKRLYGAIASRFCRRSKKQPQILNPRKERVKQILGENNEWIRRRLGEETA